MSYGFASNLRDALPNASFIGFIGTPIQRQRRGLIPVTWGNAPGNESKMGQGLKARSIPPPMRHYHVTSINANAKTTLKVATQTHNDTVAQRYPEFSSVIDLLRSAVGNNTPLGKQLTNIRKQATRQVSRSASNVIDVNASVKKAA